MATRLNLLTNITLTSLTCYSLYRLLAFVGVANFMGLEPVPCGDKRGIGYFVRSILILLTLTAVLGQ